jgi:hypothetical protein
MEIHKPREEETGISERGNNIARMGRVLRETAGRKNGRRKGRNTNEGEADGAGGNRNHSRRGRETIWKLKRRGTGEGWREAWMYGTEEIVGKIVELINGVWKTEGFPVDWREGVICPIFKKGEKNRTESYR